MKTRVVHTKVWKDSWYSNLSTEAKFVWLYLITNDRINIAGVYELTKRELEFDTGVELTEDLKKELFPKAMFYEDWICISNVNRYNKYRNSPLNEKAFVKEISLIPEKALSYFVEHTSMDSSIDTSIDTPPIPLEIRNKKLEIRNKKSKTSNKKSEIKNKKPEVSKEVLEKKKEELYEKLNWN
jgi:hypothetical protein